MTATERREYLRLVRTSEPLYQTLRKGEEQSHAYLIDAHDSKVTKVLKDILRSARRRFLLAYKPVSLDDVRTDVEAALKRAYPPDLVSQLVDVLTPIAEDVINHHLEQYGLDTSVEQANTSALAYLRDRADNVFSDLSSAQATAIYNAIAEAKAEPHTLTDVKAAVKDVVSRELRWDDRSMSADDWATMVARTEGTRAAAEGTKAVLQAGDYQTWRWLAEGSACSDCAQNDDEVVEIGETFSSGDSEPPNHPNCRCLVLPNVVELTGEDEEE